MFGFLKKSKVCSPSATMCRALEAARVPTGDDLAVVEQRGSYSGRKVTHVRIFERSSVAQRGIEVQAYGDLDAHPDLILRSGRVEEDGNIILDSRAQSIDRAAPTRASTDRAGHASDEHIVFKSASR